jgi:16S rRNA (adenine1518-N6/adenine1519-N6)-dimethyltransferase
MEHRAGYNRPYGASGRLGGLTRMPEEGPPVRLLTPTDVRELAGRLGVRPSKRLGQNFVIEPGTVRRIAALAALEPDEVALEVGPGLGSLTLALLEAGASRVVAVEIDRGLAGELPRTMAVRAPKLADRVAVITADALRIGEPDLSAASATVPGATVPGATVRAAPSAVLVANLPYNVAVPVLLHLLAALPSLARGLVMVQAEVADRMCAAPGSRVYGTPSVKLAWYAAARAAGTVPRTVFWPVPNVDSRLVAFTRHDPPATEASREEVFAVVDAAFRQRRKTLRAALSGWAGSAAEAERRLRAAGIDPGLRGESLGVAEFARLAAVHPELPRTIWPS